MSQQAPVIARRCWVSGRVQGVYYRGSARQRALQLGVCGHARNLADGRVELLLIGPASATRTLIEWLWQGPPTAVVSNVEVQEVALNAVGQLPSTFSVA